MEPTPRAQRRPRRLRTRILPIIGYAIVVLGIAWFFELRLPTTVIFVRHADTGVAMAQGSDPPLNERGRARAELLADFIQDIDVVAGVNAIYASPALRTQQTAQPLADRLGLEVQIADPYDVEDFMAHVRREHRGDIVLIVTHGDAIAPLIDELHGSKRLPAPTADDFDNVYIVTIPFYGGVKTLRLHYGVMPKAEISGATTSATGSP
jgi:broad specificity phosphatase PhoE